MKIMQQSWNTSSNIAISVIQCFQWPSPIINYVAICRCSAKFWPPRVNWTNYYMLILALKALKILARGGAIV